MYRSIWMLMMVLMGVGCGASAAKLQVAMPSGPPVEGLTQNHFQSDKSGNLSETHLREILDSPAFLEDDARLGIVQVTTAYEADPEIPLNIVPARLSEELEKTGHFEVTTEVSSDWPTNGSVAGLRELAARYRSKYLLLYRHRFVDRNRVNGWGWTWPTIVGIFATPARTTEVAGVLEASLFDVRNGTILFTVFERVYEKEKHSIYHPAHKRRVMKERMVNEATSKLAKTVKSKVGRLIAANPKRKAENVAKAKTVEEKKMVFGFEKKEDVKSDPTP